jgi:hypothetical protein
MLIGDDIVEGKVSTKPRAAPADKQGVDRGRTAVSRGDVGARGRASESEKRRQRLANVII